MSIKEGLGASRLCSIESGLTQAIAPAGLLCGIPEQDFKKSGSDHHLSVPNTPASKMAKMKKKIHSPLLRRRSGTSEVSSTSSVGKVFGVSLNESVKHSEDPPIPWVVVRIVEYLKINGLKHEGIFRVSGNKKNVDLMKAAFDRDGDADLEEFGDVMAVAGLLKQYLRDLPEPPIPLSLTQDFINIHTKYGDDNKASLDELKLLLAKLPELNYHLIKYLCNFLISVTQHEENNKMSSMALAIVFGPNIFRCKDGLEGLREQGHTNAIVCKFLQEYEHLFPEEEEVSPYATTDLLFNQTPSSSATSIHSKVYDVNTSDEELVTTRKATVEISSFGKLDPVYACIDKNKSHRPQSSSSDDLDLYVRSVSPSSWHSNGNNGSPSHSTLQQNSHGHQEKDMVQMVIKDSIKEHLFGPDVHSTDDNENSPNESAYSNESLEEIVPPLPARNYGPEDTNRPQPKKRKNVKKQGGKSSKNINDLTIDVSPVDSKGDLVIHLDQNSNSIVQVEDDDDNIDNDELSKVRRNSGILTTLTKNRAPPPSNRRSPTKRNSLTNMDGEEDDDCCSLPDKFVHPLVVEAKSRGKVSTPPPRSPRSSPRIASTKSPTSPLSPNKHATVDEIDGGYNPVKELMNRQYKKRSRGPPGVPPLELYKLQQADGEQGTDNLIKHDVQLSPRERYDGLSSDEALLSPRSRPLSIDTKSYTTECPPSPPHDHVEQFWSERRMEASPKGELSLKQISRNIHQLKKKIREYEESFEAEHGHKPSQSEKAPIKKYLTELNRYRRELKELKEKAKEDSERLIETAPAIKQGTSSTNSSTESLLTTAPASVQQSLDGILRKLQDKRKAVGRSEDLQELTLEELQDEKLAVQKALLQHENIFGRPTTKKDKDVMRPLYDRYRLIKRKLTASRTQSSTENLSKRTEEQSSTHDDMGSEEQIFATLTLLPKSKMSTVLKDKRFSEVSCGSIEDLDSNSDFGGSIENLLEDKERDAKLHHMSQDELQKQVELAKREKKRLRKKLKKFEDDFLERTGRRAQRDDRGDMEKDYKEYKQIKARLRLLDVLLNKRQSNMTI